MRYRYVLDDEALISIEAQLIWLEETVGDDLADFWMEALRNSLDQLTAHPNRNGFAPENGRWFPDVEIRQKRLRPWKPKPGWRVLFMVNDREAIVTILQIRHERQPWMGE
jgi:plasmid stabilization system protein ParE